MEIPTGAIADIYGRKTSRILSRIMAIVSTLFMLFGHSTLFFGIGFFFMALSNNLESGAGEALVYDSLKEIGKSNNYSKIRGRNELVNQISQTLSLVLGGYIATISYSGIYKTTLIISFFSLIQAFMFTEPTIGKVEKSHNFLSTFRNQLINSFKVIKKDRRIIEVVLIFELFSTFYVTEFFYIQNRLKNLDHSEFTIGIILAAGSLFAALLATQTYKIEKKMSIKKLITVFTLLAIFAFWGITIKGLEKYAFIFLSGIEGVLFVSLGDYINSLIPSEQRATILSLQSMVFSFFMIILFPMVGKIGDLFSLQVSFIVIAIISTIVLSGMIVVILSKDNSSSTRNNSFV